jgi:hypothetical protein
MFRRIYLVVAVSAVAAVATTPSSAFAGEFTADCESGASCLSSVSGSSFSLTNTNGETITCNGVSGVPANTSGSSTGSTGPLEFFGCHEKVSGFNFSCNSPSGLSGVIKTNSMVFHNVYLEPNATTPGILFTGMNTTISCASFLKKTVTGNLIGHFSNPQCGSFASFHTLTFEAIAPGRQRYTSVTTSGTSFDLQSNNDAGGQYLTTALTGSMTISDSLKLTC